MKSQWYVAEHSGDTFYVGRGVVGHLPEHIHPIGFADKREALRAADRLNARDSRILSA